MKCTQVQLSQKMLYLCKNVMLFVRLSVGFAYVSRNTLSVHEVKTDIKTIKEVNRVLVYKQNMLHLKHLL